MSTVTKLARQFEGMDMEDPDQAEAAQRGLNQISQFNESQSQGALPDRNSKVNPFGNNRGKGKKPSKPVNLGFEEEFN